MAYCLMALQYQEILFSFPVLVPNTCNYTVWRPLLFSSSCPQDKGKQTNQSFTHLENNEDRVVENYSLILPNGRIASVGKNRLSKSGLRDLKQQEGKCGQLLWC